MMIADILQLACQLLIVGFVLRLIEMKLAGTDIGKALAFIY